MDEPVAYEIDDSFEDFLVLYYRVVGTVSIVANSLVIYLIVRASPFYTKGYKISLLLLEFWFTALNIHLCWLFTPLTIFPVFGAYCRGLLCSSIEVPLHYQMVALLVIIDEAIASLLMCSFFRQQSLIASTYERLTVFQSSLAIIFLHLLLLANAVAFLFIRLPIEEQHRVLDRHPVMRWITVHAIVWEIYSSEHASTFVYLGVIVAEVVILGGVGVSSTIYIVRAVRAKRRMMVSKSTKHASRNRRVDMVVLSQLTVAVTFIVVPLIVIGASLIGILRVYELCWIAIAMLGTHSLANASIAIFLNPKYLRFLRIRLEEISGRSTQVVRVSAVSVQQRVSSSAPPPKASFSIGLGRVSRSRTYQIRGAEGHNS